MNQMLVRKVIDTPAPGLGEEIRKARLSSNRSIESLCVAAEISVANWYRVEQGRTKALPYETLRRIERALGVSFDVTFPESVD